MKKTIIALSILAVTTSSFANNKELTFYKDLTNYKESKLVNLDEPIFINLTNTAVLDTFNVSLNKDEKFYKPESVELYPKSEENIFKLNKDQVVFINDNQYILVENGDGFIKLKNKNGNELGYVTYIPKNKIDSITFKKDIESKSHIAKIIPEYNDRNSQDVELAYSYSLGEMSWKPKYDLYIKNKDNLELDYNIEIKNDTLTSFENVDVKFMLEDINRIYTDYKSDNNGGIFDFKNYYVLINDKPENKKEFVYNELGFDKNGLEYSLNTLRLNSENLVSSSLENGKRAFKFSNKVTIPSNATTSYPFKSGLEIPYEKENKFYILPNQEEGSVLIPDSTLTLKNKSGIELSSGVLRVFSGAKGYNSTVIKELNLSGNKADENIKINIGDNYSLKLKTVRNTEVFNKSDFLNLTDLVVSKSIGNLNYNHVTYKLKKLDFDIINENEEKNFTFNYPMIIEEKDIGLLKEILETENYDENYKQKIKEILKNSDDVKLYLNSFFNKIEDNNRKIEKIAKDKIDVDLTNINNISIYVLEIKIK